MNPSIIVTYRFGKFITLAGIGINLEEFPEGIYSLWLYPQGIAQLLTEFSFVNGEIVINTKQIAYYRFKP